MFIFVIIGFFFTALLLYFFKFQFIRIRKRKNISGRFDELLDEISAIFKEFQFRKEIVLFLGLFCSANHDKAVSEVYNKPNNLEIAKRTVISMWNRGK